MGKLVLGIIAVTLLQMAFFVYMATDRPAFRKAGPVKTGPADESPQLSRKADLADVVTPPSPQPAISGSQEEKLKTSAVAGRSVARVRTRPSVRDRDRAAQPNARVLASAPATSTRPTGDWDATPRPTGRLIPSGYTMALVDYPPAADSIKTPATAGMKPRDVSKPRNRSFIARAIPGLVKKPWNWIKSLASKLD